MPGFAIWSERYGTLTERRNGRQACGDRSIVSVN
jgi:hypothetical protein